MQSRKASAVVTSITIFAPDGSIDEAGCRRHFERFGEAGITTYVGGSGSGEGYTLTNEEQRQVLTIAKDVLKGTVSVRAMGCEPRNPQQMIDFAELVTEVGMDAMQVYSLEVGHDGAPSPSELRDYLTTVLDTIKIPCVPSIHQSVGYLYPVELIAEMVERYPQIIGLHVTTDAGYMTRLLEVVDPRVEIHSGGPQAAMTTLALGGNGFIGSEANIAPGLCVSMMDHYNAGRYAEAEADYRRIMGLWPLTSKYHGGRGTKAALNLLGLPGGKPRPPRGALGPAELDDVAKSVEKLGLRELLGIGS